MCELRWDSVGGNGKVHGWQGGSRSPLLRVVQLNLTPEMEVFYMLFERCLSIFSMASLKQHIEYFHSRCKIQLDLPVQDKRPSLQSHSREKRHSVSLQDTAVLAERPDNQACNVPWSSDSEVRRSDVYFRGPVLVIGSHHQMEVETSTYQK